MRITKEITLHPSLLSREYRTHILNELCATYINSCSKKYGYIVDILRDTIVYKSNYISSASNGIVFVVEVEIISIYPTPLMNIETQVSLVNENGIFTVKNNVIKIFVPVKNTEPYIYNKILKCYTFQNKIITIHNTICIKIQSVRYSNNEFNCIGILDSDI